MAENVPVHDALVELVSPRPESVTSPALASHVPPMAISVVAPLESLNTREVGLEVEDNWSEKANELFVDLNIDR